MFCYRVVDESDEVGVLELHSLSGHQDLSSGFVLGIDLLFFDNYDVLSLRVLQETYFTEPGVVESLKRFISLFGLTDSCVVGVFQSLELSV